MKDIIKFLVRFVPFLQSYPHWVQWTFFGWLFLSLGVAAVLFFTPRVKPSEADPQKPVDPTKPVINSPPVPYDTAQVTTLVALLNERAEGIRIDLDRVIEKIASLNKADAANQLKELKARFLLLHERHIAAIRLNDIIMSHEIDGEIFDVLSTIRSIVSTTVGETARQWYASLGRAYLDAPTRDEDPKYAAVQDDVLELRKETTDRTGAMIYPGEPPASISKPLSDLAFVPASKPPPQPGAK
jgi:hypothetical protein